MRTTKKLLAAVLAACMLTSTAVVSGFAATVDDDSTVGTDTAYSTAAQAIDDEYAYDDDDLGATYTADATTFKVWSPTASEVSVNLYATGSDNEEGAEDKGTYALDKVMNGDEWTGVWSITIEGDLKNVYYTYTITTTNTTGDDEQTYETQDVYSKATGVNGNRSMVVDLDSTDPEGWDEDTHVLLDESTDSSVWELHIKDFSYDESSGVSEENRGKYLAFTETGTTLNNEGNISTCIDYLKELGVTTVQLNPFYDYQSVDEAGSDDQFNWGYDPQNYNVPEGSYSSNAYDGNVRINECKQMIQALHNAGISVVMDVVYNHTYSTDSCFQYTVPNYYYRMNADGTFSNGSGCGNECATERAMYRNYVIQSVLYWVNEYHVDGFRFDLMGIMDVETMNLIRDALDKVDSRITMWGEGWSGGTSTFPTTTCTGAEFTQAVQSNASKLNSRIAMFNDGIRDGLKGSVFGISNKGFLQGTKGDASKVARGVRATASSWSPQAPSQCVTYDSCHDNATLYDQLVASTGVGDYGERYSDTVKMNKLAGAVIYTSQGISFILAGEEMSRSKDGDTNSYKSSAELNMIKWQNVVDYADVVSYYKGMMEIKSAFSPLTAMDKSYYDSYTFTQGVTKSTNQISFTITNDVEGEWNKMAVIYNSASEAVDVTLKDTSVTDWVIIADDESAGLTSLGEVSGSTFTVPAYSAIVAVDKEGYESAALQSNMGKVRVNYIYESTGEQVSDTTVIQGTIGSGYQTTDRSADVDDIYVLSRVEGETTGTFTDDTQVVTYYYTDYIPESIQNADFNQDGIVDICDVTYLQKKLAGLVTPSDEILALMDLDYSGAVDVSDATMLAKALVKIPVSSGTVVTNYYYTNSDGELESLFDSEVISGQVGSDYTTNSYKVVGYAIDESKTEGQTSGKIPYTPGSTTEVNYYYTASSLDITLHIKHSGSETWVPYLWTWGSNLKGQDSGNFQTAWPGDAATEGEDGWFNYSFTYKGSGTYNVIVSNNANPQTIDYKGFVDNEMWVVIDDDAVNSGSQDFLTFYTDNPETNPDAPIAQQVTLS